MADQEQKQPEIEESGEPRDTAEGQVVIEEVTAAEAPGDAPESAEQTAGEPADGGDAPAGADVEDAARAEDRTDDENGDSLEQMVSQLQDDLVAARDAALRAQADAQNVKRRAAQDVEKAHKFALEGFAKELLPVVDNLERALEAASGDDEAIKPIAEGVELTLKSFFGALSKFKIDQVDPQGEPFDPNLHQAMSMVENPDVEPNTVIAVMQKGYTLNGRLVRPAMVMVSKNGG